MLNVTKIPIQKLFLLTVILKVGSAGIGWYIGDPWGFGFALPLFFMSAYIVLGIKRTDTDVSDANFADTCYYLGFIFTISSIIFSLFDLPQIGTKIQVIAIRFGAAMVTTVFGLIVRVYLVNFKQDIEEAVRAAEQAAIDAAYKLREHLAIAVEKLQEFEVKVEEAANHSIAKVSVGVEELTKSYGEKLTTLFEHLAKENTKAIIQGLADIKVASDHLAQSMAGYSASMKGNLVGIENKVTEFANAVTTRMATTTFPDDYFAKRLEAPLGKLAGSAINISTQVDAASGEMVGAVTSMQNAIGTLRARSAEVEGAIERVVTLAASQEQLLVGSKAQVEALGVVGETLRNLETHFSELANRVGAQTDITAAAARFTKEQTGTLIDVSKVLNAAEATFRNASGKMDVQQQSIANIASMAERQTGALGAVSSELQKLAQNLGKVIEAISGNSTELSNMSSRLNSALATKEDVSGVQESIRTASGNVTALGNEMSRFLRGFDALATRLSGLQDQLHTNVPDGGQPEGVQIAPATVKEKRGFFGRRS